jgi:pimeloyl-ACP methyl ester carboxylesterase
MTDHDVTARDGRTLKVTEGGDPGGVPIMGLHGMPGSRVQYGPMEQRARERSIRLLSYDRPGYGGSDRHEGRNVADCAADVRAIAGALGIGRLGLWGHSGGGPHAAACAALLEGLVPAVGVLASSAPYGAPGLDYFAGTGELNVEDAKLFLSDRDAAYTKGQRDEEEMLAADPSQLEEMLRSLLSPVDAALLDDRLAAFMTEQTRVGLEPRHDGWWDDGVATMSDWGFGLTQIRTPVLVMHGREDRFVPIGHGEWLARNIPGAEARFYDEDGHLTVFVNRIDEVHDWLLERMATK